MLDDRYKQIHEAFDLYLKGAIDKYFFSFRDDVQQSRDIRFLVVAQVLKENAVMWAGKIDQRVLDLVYGQLSERW